jgi:glycosyltransferase involved in cell wall biosynthesis
MTWLTLKSKGERRVISRSCDSNRSRLLLQSPVFGDPANSHRRSPKILFLSPSWLHSDSFGGQLRALHTARALKDVGDLTVAVVSANADDGESMLKTAQEFSVKAPIRQTRRLNRGLIEKARWALDPSYLNLHGTVASPVDRDRIISDSAYYDLVWVLNSRVPNILQRYYWPHTHLDVDDVPSTYLQTVARNGNTIRERVKAFMNWWFFKRRELLLTRRFTTLSVCSEADRQYLGGSDRIHVIPNGFERPQFDPVPNPLGHPPRLGFVGLCSYAPNLEGVRWFLQEVWPIIRKAVPGTRFRLVGKDTDKALHSGVLDVDALGWVADPTAEIASWSAMVIPIRFGGGTRVKVADAFSRKCPVVSTRLGAFGYDVEHGRELLLADDPAAFAAACVALIHHPTHAARMAERAYGAFLEKWTWDAIAPRIWAAAEDCLRRSSSASPVLQDRHATTISSATILGNRSIDSKNIALPISARTADRRPAN